MAHIYKTTNLTNGKIYIGKSSKDDPLYLGSGLILKEAIQKYGIENFKKEIIEQCGDSIVDEREIFWIESLRAREREVGYNIASGGTGGDTTSKHPSKDEIIKKRIHGLVKWHETMSPEEKQILSQKIRDAKIGKSNGRDGKTHSVDTIKRMSESALLRENSEQWVKSHADAMAKRRGNPLVKKFKRVVVDGIEYDSVKSAITDLGIKHRKTFYDMIKKNIIKVEYV